MIIQTEKLVEQMVKAIADYPDEVLVSRKLDNMGVLLSVNLNPHDCAMVIGRQGEVIKAIRTVARVVGIKNNERVAIKVIDHGRR